MPAVPMPGIAHVNINAGGIAWGGNSATGTITIHTDRKSAPNEETLVHEATHVTLDPAHYDSPGWRAAQEADGVFISNYARDNSDREDVAESLLAWFAVRYLPERPTPVERTVILRTIPNRVIYLDGQGFDMSPYTPSEVRYSSEGFLSIRGRVIGPDDQPLEGIRLWAWTGSEDNSRTATTGQDGSFALLAPDAPFSLDVFALGEECAPVGWHGPGGFTTIREEATLFRVDGESVPGIVVRPPFHPEALPRTEWCARPTARRRAVSHRYGRDESQPVRVEAHERRAAHAKGPGGCPDWMKVPAMAMPLRHLSSGMRGMRVRPLSVWS